jgi:hypothetical protein
MSPGPTTSPHPEAAIDGPPRQPGVLEVDDAVDGGPVAFIRTWWKVLAGTLVLLVALYIAFTWPLAVHLDSVPDEGDPLLNTWALSWVAHQLPVAPARLVHANIFYPERYTLLYSESLLLPAIVFAPLQWAGVHGVVVYNVAFAAGVIFSGVGTALLVLELTGDAAAAVVAAIAFAFLPFRVDHASHLQLQQTQWIPVALWALHRMVRRRRMSDAVLVGVASACQLYSCVYFGLMLMPFLATVAIVLLAAHFRVRHTPVELGVWIDRRVGIGLATCTIVAGVAYAGLTAPLGLAYTRASAVVGERVDAEAAVGSARLSDYLVPPVSNVWYGEATRAWGPVERRLFPGLTLLVLAAVGVWRSRSRPMIAYLVALVVAIDVSTGVRGVTFNLLWHTVGAFRGLRVPARMGLFAGFALCVLAAMGVSALRTSGGAWTRRLVPVVAAGLIMVEGWSRLPVGTTLPAGIPPAYAAILHDLNGAPATAIADLPIAASMPTYMYYSTFHWQNLLTGYSGFFPPSFVELVRALETFPDAQSLHALRRRHAQYVVLHGEVFRPEEYADLATRADASPDLTLLSTSRWRGGEMRVYRLRADTP